MQQNCKGFVVKWSFNMPTWLMTTSQSHSKKPSQGLLGILSTTQPLCQIALRREASANISGKLLKHAAAQSGPLSARRRELLEEHRDRGETNSGDVMWSHPLHDWSGTQSDLQWAQHPCVCRAQLVKKPALYKTHSPNIIDVKRRAATTAETHISADETQPTWSEAHRSRRSSLSSFKGQWKLLRGRPSTHFW